MGQWKKNITKKTTQHQMHLYQFIYLSLGCERPNNGESESVNERVQAAQLLTQQPRQHGDHLESDETDTEG